MTSKKYWALRSAQDMVDRMGTAEQTAAEISAAVAQSGEYLAGEVRAVLRGMQSFGISEAEAMRIINAAGDGNALQGLRRAAQRVNDPVKRNALMNAINSAGAYRYRIERIEELYKDIDSTCRSLYRTENRLTTSALQAIAEDSYYHEIFNLQQGTGMQFGFSRFSQRDVDRILRANWFGGNYSQRIWRDMNGLSERLKRELLVSMLTGRSGEKTARIFRERFGVSDYCARRIVRTESAYVANAAQMCAYDEAGIDKYRFVATLDKRTSEACAALDGKVFPTKDAKPGKNYPPMHPFCRSTTIAEFGDGTLSDLAQRARDADGNIIALPEDMGYDEWYGKYVEGGRQLSIESKKVERAALPGERRLMIAEHQTAPALLTTSDSGGESLTNALNSGTISSNRFEPLPQNNVVNILRGESKEWINQLTQEEIRAVSKYTKNSGDITRPKFYERINAMLRGDIPEDSKLRYYANTISSALKKNTLKHDIVCYRCVSTDVFQGYEPGNIYFPKQFYSTSVTPKGALTGEYKIIVHAPAGSQGAYIEELSAFPNQRECLFDKDCAYRVLSRSANETEIEVII